MPQIKIYYENEKTRTVNKSPKPNTADDMHRVNTFCLNLLPQTTRVRLTVLKFFISIAPDRKAVFKLVFSISWFFICCCIRCCFYNSKSCIVGSEDPTNRFS